jgi:hypothetical protein
MQEFKGWFSPLKDKPPLREDVLVIRLPMKGSVMKKPIINIAYLFELKKDERQGRIHGEVMGDYSINLADGGVFWAFPCIQRLEDVVLWRPLPKIPEGLWQPEEEKK